MASKDTLASLDLDKKEDQYLEMRSKTLGFKTDSIDDETSYLNDEMEESCNDDLDLNEETQNTTTSARSAWLRPKTCGSIKLLNSEDTQIQDEKTTDVPSTGSLETTEYTNLKSVGKQRKKKSVRLTELQQSRIMRLHHVSAKSNHGLCELQGTGVSHL
jgi:hypothetical protein